MNTTITNATEYRDLPLFMLTESTTNPCRIFEDDALKRSRKHFSHSMTYFFAERTSTPPIGPRVGLTADRVLGKAVERNRIKRRMREAVRWNWPIMCPRHIIGILRCWPFLWPGAPKRRLAAGDPRSEGQ